MFNNVNLLNSQNYKNVEFRTEVEKAGKGFNNAQISVDDFLKIMAAEISNQSISGDDGGGGGKSDYVSQLSQLTTLEYMGDLSNTLNFLKFQQEQQLGISLVGQEVKVLQNGEETKGIVDRVKFKNGLTYIEINGLDYYVGNITETGVKSLITTSENISTENKHNENIKNVDFEEHNASNNVLNNIPNTRRLSRKEMTEDYFNSDFLKEKEFFDNNFKKLI